MTDPTEPTPPSIYRRLGESTPLPQQQPAAPATPAAPAGAPAGGMVVNPAAALLPGQRNYTLAGWGARAGAFLIDSLLFGLLGFVLYLVAALAEGLTVNEAVLFFAIPVQPETIADPTVLYAARAVGGLVPVVAMAVALALTNGRTPGKRITGIRVVTTTGRRMSWNTAVMRQVVLQGGVLAILSWITLGLAWFLNYLWPLWDSQHRAGHDRFAGTRVVRELPPPESR